MSKRKNTSIYIVAFIIFFGGLGYLFFSGVSTGGIEVLSVAEARALPQEKLQGVRLFGTVANFPKPELGAGRGAKFYITDENDPQLVLLVDFKGAVPDTFEPGIEVYVEGFMQTQTGQDTPFHFAASTLRTKCPSKYEKENRT
jgi:cytochrome c-type biogenesis protein CcmE